MKHRNYRLPHFYFDLKANFVSWWYQKSLEYDSSSQWQQAPVLLSEFIYDGRFCDREDFYLTKQFDAFSLSAETKRISTMHEPKTGCSGSKELQTMFRRKPHGVKETFFQKKLFGRSSVHTLLFYQIEPLKNGVSLILPSSIARNS